MGWTKMCFLTFWGTLYFGVCSVTKARDVVGMFPIKVGEAKQWCNWQWIASRLKSTTVYVGSVNHLKMGEIWKTGPLKGDWLIASPLWPKYHSNSKEYRFEWTDLVLRFVAICTGLIRVPYYFFYSQVRLSVSQTSAMKNRFKTPCYHCVINSWI